MRLSEYQKQSLSMMALLTAPSSVLRQLQNEHDWIRVLTLSRNFGTHSATAAGVVATQGDWIITLDEDLQHHPQHFESMLREAVMGTPVARISSTPSQSLMFMEATGVILDRKPPNGFWQSLASTPQIIDFNSYRLIRGDIGRAAAASCTNQTYFDMALTWFTTSVKTLPLELKDLRYIEGHQSGFNLGKLASHAKKLLISSRVNIATKGMYVGLFTIVLAALAGVIVIIQHLFFPDVIRSDGWASLIVLISFFSGVVVSILCLALEYINIMLQQQMGQPNYPSCIKRV